MYIKEKEKVYILGRKRTSKKRDLTLSVDREIIDDLNKYEENKSKLFTDAAIIRLKELKEREQKD